MAAELPKDNWRDWNTEEAFEWLISIDPELEAKRELMWKNFNYDDVLGKDLPFVTVKKIFDWCVSERYLVEKILKKCQSLK